MAPCGLLGASLKSYKGKTVLLGSSLGALLEILYGKEGDSWSQGDSSLGALGSSFRNPIRGRRCSWVAPWGLLGALFEILYGKEGDSWSQGNSSLGALGSSFRNPI